LRIVDQDKVLARRLLANSASNRKASLMVALAAVVASLVLISIVLFETHQGYFRWASATLLTGTFLISMTAIRALFLVQENRLQKILTAMSTAENAREVAEAAAHEKSRLLATMSHEIRTPLNGVIGMVGLLLETELNAEQQNYANTANASSRILLSIIDEILDTAKAQNAPSRKLVDLNALIENVTELLAPRAHAKGIEISTFLASRAPEQIECNELHLRQILFNLAGNAIKFTERGCVGIEIDIDDKNQIIIKISDTGIGMTKDEASRVFDEFVQANSGTAKRFGGTGLGLAISRKLVMDMGGKIEVSSTPGEGSCFEIVLTGPYQRTIVTEKLALHGQAYHLALQKGIASNHIAQRLQDLGAEVSFVQNIVQLDGLLQSTDLNLNIISDLSFASSLKRWSKHASTNAALQAKIWVMMKAEERRDNKNFLTRPFAGYLLKPLRRATMISQFTLADMRSVEHASAKLRSLATIAKSKSKTKVGLSILLAEDNPVNALLIRTMLERHGHKVHHVNNGLAALEFFDAGSKVDLALIDIEMPKLDGLETTRAIRAREDKISPRKSLPVLALTANVRAEDIAACREAGMNDHLAKPFDQVDLEEKIELLLGRRFAA